MKTMRAAWRTLGGVAIVLAGAVAHALWRCDLGIVNRYGTLVVLVGVLVDYWPILRTKSVDDLAFWGTQEGHDATRIAIVVVCFGTLIQGYGDWAAAWLIPVRTFCTS